MRGCSLDLQVDVGTSGKNDDDDALSSIYQAMMRYSPVGIPPAVSSLADEVDGPGARFHTSTT